jgi:dihydrofolate reductase
LLSLDGIAEHPMEFITEFDDAMRDNLVRVIGSQDAVLLGRHTYDDWAAYWPNSETEPFSTFINTVQKFVVTSTPPERTWPGTSVVGGDLLEFVADLKDQPGADIGVHGSISLAQSLLAAGFVDELRLVIAPAVHRHGRKLFEHADPKRLKLIRSITSPNGYLLVDFQVL